MRKIKSSGAKDLADAACPESKYAPAAPASDLQRSEKYTERGYECTMLDRWRRGGPAPHPATGARSAESASVWPFKETNANNGKVPSAVAQVKFMSGSRQAQVRFNKNNRSHWFRPNDEFDAGNISGCRDVLKNIRAQLTGNVHVNDHK